MSRDQGRRLGETELRADAERQQDDREPQSHDPALRSAAAEPRSVTPEPRAADRELRAADRESRAAGREPPPTVCAIGTTEPWLAAGLGLDIALLIELGVRPVIVVAGVSAQDGTSLFAAVPLPPALIRAQFAALAGARIAALRIGALLDAASIDAVAALIGEERARRGAPIPTVLDPVFTTSAGGVLEDDATITALRERLCPLVTVITPNIAEAERLLGRSIPDLSAMEDAARRLTALGPAASLVKGGHLAGDPVDVLCHHRAVERFSGARLPVSMRGTGCTLADAIAAQLALGAPIATAVRRARAFVERKIAGAHSLGGMRTAL